MSNSACQQSWTDAANSFSNDRKVLSAGHLLGNSFQLVACFQLVTCWEIAFSLSPVGKQLVTCWETAFSLSPVGKQLLACHLLENSFQLVTCWETAFSLSPVGKQLSACHLLGKCFQLFFIPLPNRIGGKRELSFIYRYIVHECQIKHFQMPKRRSPNANKMFLIAIISILAIENIVFGNRKQKIVKNFAFKMAAYPL